MDSRLWQAGAFGTFHEVFLMLLVHFQEETGALVLDFIDHLTKEEIVEILSIKSSLNPVNLPNSPN